ncbi:MAG: 5-oxoprolinase subunit PxpA [Pseudomonadota bacterium]
MSLVMDLNADLGEGGQYDEALMALITSCNIACGGHTGDEASMRAALSLAKAHNVAAGAHPSFPDRENFGRVDSELTGAALEQKLSEQVEALKQIAAELDIAVTHLKPHGALYNMAARDPGLAASVADVTASLLPGAALVGPPESELTQAAARTNLLFIAEGFADRAYEADGQLRSRQKAGAVLTDPEQQSQQALNMALNHQVSAYTGERLSLPVQTLCLHGDTPGALEAARAIRETLEQNGVEICRLT